MLRTAPNDARYGFDMAKRHEQIRHRGLQFTGREFRPHATTLGQLIFAWNDLHEQLAAIYWTLAGYSDNAIAEWNKPKVDNHKRDLIRRWVNALPPAHRNMAVDMWNDVVWLVDTIDTLTDFRNDAAHAPVTIEPESFLARRDNFTAGVISNSAWRNRRALNLIRKDLLAEFRWQRNVAIKLRDYALNVERALSDEYTPWPNRPEWPDRPKSAQPMMLPARLLSSSQLH
jgi:hypothetical protein